VYTVYQILSESRLAQVLINLILAHLLLQETVLGFSQYTASKFYKVV